jgi:hypothetical protein
MQVTSSNEGGSTIRLEVQNNNTYKNLIFYKTVVPKMHKT